MDILISKFQLVLPKTVILVPVLTTSQSTGLLIAKKWVPFISLTQVKVSGTGYVEFVVDQKGNRKP